MHRKMKRRIIILHYPNDFFCLYFRSKFFADFADNALLGRFARFKLSTGKFPAAFKIAVAALNIINLSPLFKNFKI